MKGKVGKSGGWLKDNIVSWRIVQTILNELPDAVAT